MISKGISSFVALYLTATSLSLVRELCAQGVPSPPRPAMTTTRNRTLDSIRRIAPYNTWVMTYDGDYESERLRSGNRSWTERLGPITCASFSARSTNGDALFGYNQDSDRLQSSLIIFADSSTGFASVSIVRGDFCHIDEYIANPNNYACQERVLESVNYPFDGMNEYGVTMSPMYVQGEPVATPGLPAIHGLTMIRRVLDHARNLNEAIALIRRYNNTYAREIHYLVSDAYGRSAVVEYFDRAIIVTKPTEPWQVCTNERICGNTIEELRSICWRYRTAYDALRSSNGRISADAGLGILQSISWEGGGGGTLWSSMYNKTAGEWRFCLDRDYANRHSFTLRMVVDLGVDKAGASPLIIDTGSVLHLRADVRNLSPRPSTAVRLKFYLSRSIPMGDDAVLLAGRTVTSVGARSKEAIRLDRRIPASLPPGEYHLVATAIEPGKTHTDPSLSNNTDVFESVITVR